METLTAIRSKADLPHLIWWICNAAMLMSSVAYVFGMVEMITAIGGVVVPGMIGGCAAVFAEED